MNNEMGWYTEGNRGGIIWDAVAAFVEISEETHTKNQNSEYPNRESNLATSF